MDVPCEKHITQAVVAAVYWRENKGKLNTALEILKGTLNCIPSSRNIPMAKTLVYGQMAITLEKMAKYEDMKKICEQMIKELDYRHAAFYHRMLSEYYLHTGDVKFALIQAHEAYRLAKKYNLPDRVWYSHQVVTTLSVQPGISKHAMEQTVEKERRDLLYSLSLNPTETERDVWALSAYFSALRYNRKLLKKYKTSWVIKQLFTERFWIRVFRMVTKRHS